MSRVLGVDLGAKRVGVAISDSARRVATPIEVVLRSGNRGRDHRALRALVDSCPHARQQAKELVWAKTAETLVLEATVRLAALAEALERYHQQQQHHHHHQRTNF